MWRGQPTTKNKGIEMKLFSNAKKMLGIVGDSLSLSVPINFKNTDDFIELTGLRFVSSVYFIFNNARFSVTDIAGDDRYIMTKGFWEHLATKEFGDLAFIDHRLTTDDINNTLISIYNFEDISGVAFIHNMAWHICTEREAAKHGIKEDFFSYKSFSLGLDYDESKFTERDLIGTYDFYKHLKLVQDNKEG